MRKWLEKLTVAIRQGYSKSAPDLIFILFLLIAAVIFFGKVLLAPGLIIYGPWANDTINFFYPIYNLAYSIIGNGDFPYWNSFVFSGYPLAANPQLALFYPLNFLFLALPTNIAFGYSYLLHVFLGGLFMYLLVRHIGLDRVCAFVSAIVFMFSAFIITHIYAGHYSMICAAIWIPLIFLLFEMALRQKSLFYGLLTGAILGIQLLAGHVQISYLTLIALAFYLVFKCFLVLRQERDYKIIGRPLLIFALVLIAGISLSAIELIPTYEFSLYSTRAGGMSYETATSFSLNPRFLILTLANPWAGPSWISGSMPVFCFWEYTSYIGIFPLVLILFAIYFKRNNSYIQFFSLLAIISVFLALGKYFPPYWLLYKAAPGFDLFRVPARFIFLVTFAASILAGFGFNCLRGRLTQQQKSYVWKIATVMALLAIFISVSAIFVAKGYFPILKSMMVLKLFPVVIIAVMWKSMIVLTLLLLVSIAIIALRLKSKLPGKYFTTIAVVFIIANLWFYHVSAIDVKPASEVYSAPPYVEYLQENSAGYRVYDPENIIPKNHLMVYGVPEIDGYDATALNYYSEFFGNDSGQIGGHPGTVTSAVGISSLGTKLGLLNTKYVLSSKPLADNDFTLVYYYNDVYIYEYLKVLPKAFIVHKAEVITSEDDILTRLNDKEFNPKEYVILEDGSGNVALNNNGDFEEETIYRYSPNEIIVKTGSEHPGFLVIGEIWYPSWKVYVDGKLSQVLKTDYTLMSVYLGSGNHTVQFVYDDQLFKTGIAISSATAILLAVIISIYVIRRRRAKS